MHKTIIVTMGNCGLTLQIIETKTDRLGDIEDKIMSDNPQSIDWQVVDVGELDYIIDTATDIRNIMNQQ